MPFGMQLKRYIDHFGLIEADVAYLIGSNSQNIINIIKGDQGVNLKTMEKIAKFFGVSYFEMGNPNFPFPKKEELPIKTQNVILKRQELGIPVRDYANDLAGNLDDILGTAFLNIPRTAREIWQQLPEEVRNKISPRRITDLLGKSPRNTIVEKDGKRGREQLFRLKTVADK